MKYRRVGKSGLRISEISLGGWLTYGGSVDSELGVEIVRRAIELGVNFIDISDIYSKGKAEEVIGRAIEPMTRSDLVISSKLFWPMSDNVNDRGLSRKHIMESVEKSLKRIGTDYLDMYFCHRFDPETEVEETVRAMDDLVREGKILYWGTSVWEASQIEQAVNEAKAFSGYLPVVEQPCYNMLDRHIETEILPTCTRYGIGLVVWSPLAQGLLTGKYDQGAPEDSRGARTDWLKGIMTESNLAKVKQIGAIARDMNITTSQLALAWTLRLPEISCAITGATNVTQVEENVIASDIEVPYDVLEAIESILTGSTGE
ncbi:MAG: aldo/keto reductase family protein [candidate division Zixibacteria bacterium]|nr:aldo/keto reductase family protein [candidate division Zixibacteria bacterium]MDH3937322.1 aldo/keto reductase family protein [candidate division Zixibacteria bacterium]MDH4033656.1 aldo/keto reductase family protein [candidate division Zixibacteria bacterium]